MKIAIIALIVCMAGFAVAAPTAEIMERGFWDSVYDMLGIGAIKGAISALHGVAKVKLMTAFTTAVTMGSTGLAAAKQIMSEAMADMKEHAGNGNWILTNAADKMTQALADIKAGGSGTSRAMEERALVDTLLNMVGFNDVKDQILGLHSNMMGQFTSVLASLVFGGKAAWASAKEILNELHSDLKNHVGSAKEHFENAVKDLSAIANKHIGGNNARSMDVQRGFFDVVAKVFNISDIWDTMMTVSGNIKADLMSVLTSLFMKGSSAWSEAVPVFQALHENLKDHAKNTVAASVQGAIDQLKVVLSHHASNIIG